MYDGARLAKAANLVVVCTNYRLGWFGWMNHPALQAGDPDDPGRCQNTIQGNSQQSSGLAPPLAAGCGPI